MYDVACVSESVVMAVVQQTWNRQKDNNNDDDDNYLANNILVQIRFEVPGSKI